MTTTEHTHDTETVPAVGASLSDAAAEKVRELIETEGDPNLMLRLAVRPGGCSGFSYDMFFDTQVDDTDVISEKGGCPPGGRRGVGGHALRSGHRLQEPGSPGRRVRHREPQPAALLRLRSVILLSRLPAPAQL